MSTRFTFHPLALAGAALLAGCGGDGGTTSRTPASVAVISSAAITATVGTVVTPAPQFVVRDASGNAISGAGVTIAVTTGGGTLTGAPSSSSASGTSVGTWTLGNTAGPNTLTITVAGLSAPLTISATGTADVPTQLTVASGNAQSAFGGATLASPVAFKVGDKFNNGVANVAVSFSVTGGGGSLPAGVATVVTDANGVAVAPQWTLGKSTGAQQLRATAGSLTGNASATVTSDFFLDVRFFGPAIDPTIQAAFFSAATRIQGLVVGDLPNVTLTAFNISGNCGITGVPAMSESVDDVIVFAQVAPIDGPGGVLGSAGPCFGRTPSGLALISVMNFDSADLQSLLTSNRLNDTILHEMMHTIGLGTLWVTTLATPPRNLISGATTASSAYIGTQGVAGCLFHGGTLPSQCGGGTVPLETTGGSGTRDSHWREVTTGTGIGFNTELMTGFAEPAGVAMPMSRMSIGSLGDLGYTVNLLAADAYTVPSTLVAALSQIREAQGIAKMELNELMITPVGMVDAAGRVTRIQPR